MTARQLARHLLLLARQDVKAAELPPALQPVFTALKQAAGAMSVADVAVLTYADLPAGFKAKVTEAQFVASAERVRARAAAEGRTVDLG